MCATACKQAVNGQRVTLRTACKPGTMPGMVVAHHTNRTHGLDAVRRKSRMMSTITSSLRLAGIVSVVLSVVWAAEPLFAQPLAAMVPRGDVAVQADQQPAAAARSVRVGMAESAGPVTIGAVAGDMPLVHPIQAARERLEMTVNSSRILTLDQKMPQAQVDNPDLLDLVPLSPNQVQISAKKAGVTQVRLWRTDKRIFSVRRRYPGRRPPTLRDPPLAVSQDRADARARRQRRHYLRLRRSAGSGSPHHPHRRGMLWKGQGHQPHDRHGRAAGAPAREGHGGIADEAPPTGVRLCRGRHQREPVRVGDQRPDLDDGQRRRRHHLLRRSTAEATGYLFEGGRSFFAVLHALRHRQPDEDPPEPNLVAISGRPAYVYVGGSFGTAVSSISDANVTWQQYGTRVDMVPIVLGGGRIRLEVRPSVSQRDDADGVQGIPALKTREAETGVEMRAGQTLAIAGLLEQQVEADQLGPALGQRSPLRRGPVPKGQPPDQRGRADRSR